MKELTVYVESSMASDFPEHAVEMVDAAFNRGDLEAELDFYEASAVVVMEPARSW